MQISASIYFSPLTISLGVTWHCIFFCPDDTHKAHISTYTQHSNTITSGRWLLENHPNLSSPQSWKKGGRFPGYIKGEVVASVPASLHLSPVYSNHTAAVSSPAFILLYFSISLFCFSPDSDWVSSAPGEQSYEPDVLS